MIRGTLCLCGNIHLFLPIVHVASVWFAAVRNTRKISAITQGSTLLACCNSCSANRDLQNFIFAFVCLLAGARNNSRQGVASTAWGPGSSYADPLMMPRRHPEQRPHTASSVERRVREQFRKEQLEAERVQPPRNRQDVRRRRAEYDAAAKQEGLVQRNWALVADLGARRGVERAVANTAANGRYGMQRRAEEAGRSLVEQQAAHAVRQMRGAHRGGGNADGMLVADEVKRQERWCTHCRGLHDPAKVGDPKWRPYTGQMRLENLGVVSPEFAGRYETGMLPVSLKETTAMDATNLDPVAGGSTNEMTRRWVDMVAFRRVDMVAFRRVDNVARRSVNMVSFG